MLHGWGSGPEPSGWLPGEPRAVRRSLTALKLAACSLLSVPALQHLCPHSGSPPSSPQIRLQAFTTRGECVLTAGLLDKAVGLEERRAGGVQASGTRWGRRQRGVGGAACRVVSPGSCGKEDDASSHTRDHRRGAWPKSPQEIPAGADQAPFSQSWQLLSATRGLDDPCATSSPGAPSWGTRGPRGPMQPSSPATFMKKASVPGCAVRRHRGLGP